MKPGHTFTIEPMISQGMDECYFFLCCVQHASVPVRDSIVVLLKNTNCVDTDTEEDNSLIFPRLLCYLVDWF